MSVRSTSNTPTIRPSRLPRFTQAFQTRCESLANGTIRALPSLTCDEASLTALLAAGGNSYAGLDNAMQNRCVAVAVLPAELSRHTFREKQNEDDLWSDDVWSGLTTIRAAAAALLFQQVLPPDSRTIGT